MIQPDPYEVVHTVQEPIVTHHVAYQEKLAATTTDRVISGGGANVIAYEEEIMPLEARYATMQTGVQAGAFAQTAPQATTSYDDLPDGSQYLDISNFYDDDPNNDFAVLRTKNSQNGL